MQLLGGGKRLKIPEINFGGSDTSIFGSNRKEEKSI
jgi:hypothetical protein